MLDAVSLALRDNTQVTLPGKPRMADFATWVTACESFILPEGKSTHHFIEVYFENREEAVELEIEASPTGAAIRAFMDAMAETRWAGTAEDLLSELNERVSEDTRHEHGWPRNGRALSGKIKRLATSLRSVGLQVRWSRVNGRRIITLQKASRGRGDAIEEQGDADKGRGDATDSRRDPDSTGSKSDESARVTQMDANYPESSFLESPLKKKGKGEGEKEKKDEGNVASFASPSPLDPLAGRGQAVTQTNNSCGPFASPPPPCATQCSPPDCREQAEKAQEPGVEAIPQDDEVMTLLTKIKQRCAGMTHFFWHVPGSGYPNGYLSRAEYFSRLKACLASSDVQQRAAAIEEIKGRLSR